MRTLTPAARKGLEWLAAQDKPVSVFRAGDPNIATMAALVRAGVARECGGFGLIAYEITPMGLQALAQRPSRRVRRDLKRDAAIL